MIVKAYRLDDGHTSAGADFTHRVAEPESLDRLKFAARGLERALEDTIGGQWLVELVEEDGRVINI